MPSKSRKSGAGDALVITGREAQQVPLWPASGFCCHSSVEDTYNGGTTVRGGVPAGLGIGVVMPQEFSEELLTADVLSPEEALLPCSLNAAMAGASGGALGAVFGFGAKAV